MNSAFAWAMSAAFLGTLFAAPPNSQRSEDAAVKALLTRMERDWDDVAVTRDSSVLERILADDWTYWDTQSRFKTKAQEIERTRTSVDKCDPMTLDDLFVRVYGNAAVVTGREAGQCHDAKTAQTDKFRQRFTDVFVKRNGRWQCVATHESPLPEDKSQ